VATEEAAAVEAAVAVPQVAARMDHTALFHLAAVHPLAPALVLEAVPAVLTRHHSQVAAHRKVRGANRLVDKARDIV
jgi:hypothetical protein